MGSHRHFDYDVVYRFIVAYKRTNDGNSPTMREIQEQCGIASTNTVLWILRALEREGKIRITSNLSRGICVTGGSWNVAKEA